MNQSTIIEKYINLAEGIDKNISKHGSSIWEGFESVPFIIYNNEFQVAVGTHWPERYEKVKENIWIATGSDDELMGCTCITYHEQIVAIWDIRTWEEDIDLPHATGDVFHEMFHVHQYKLKYFKQESKEDDDRNIWLDAMTIYPHNPKSVALMLSENQFLLDIINHPEAKQVLENLKMISSLRNERQAALGKAYIEYDQGEETGEGTAVYAEIKMTALLSGKSIAEVAMKYTKYLTTTASALQHYRRRLYPVGLILCLSCDILKLDLQNEFGQSDNTIFDWIKTQIDFQSEDIQVENLISEENLKLAQELLESYENEKEKQISLFTSQPFSQVEGEIQIVMFDPMNIICHQNQCLHKHGRVKINGKELLLEHPFLVEFEDNILNVKKFFIPADKTY